MNANTRLVLTVGFIGLVITIINYAHIGWLGPLVIGPVVGGILWWNYLKPISDNNHERRRRELGLPPKRKLPEDS